MRKTLRGSNLFGEAKLHTLRCHEVEKAFAVSAHVAIDFGQRGKVFAFGLGNVENIHGSESVQPDIAISLAALLACSVLLFSFLADHRGKNEDTLFASFNEAAKRVPSAESCDVGGIRFLSSDEHDVAEAVGAKLRHCSEVCGEDFAVTALQRCDEEIDGLFGSCVDFF